MYSSIICLRTHTHTCDILERYDYQKRHIFVSYSFFSMLITKQNKEEKKPNENIY